MRSPPDVGYGLEWDLRGVTELDYNPGVWLDEVVAVRTTEEGFGHETATRESRPGIDLFTECALAPGAAESPVEAFLGLHRRRELVLVSFNELARERRVHLFVHAHEPRVAWPSPL